MIYSYNVVFSSENPYELFKTADDFAENTNMLNKLSSNDKVCLATRIISGCPYDEFKNYRRHLGALRQLPISNAETFYSIIIQAYEVRNRIELLLDSSVKEPYQTLLRNFNPKIFHLFSDLSEQLLEGNESFLAGRIALDVTTEDERQKIACILVDTFPNNLFADKLRDAFTLHDMVTNLLLGEKPIQFFLSPDYNHEQCKIFSNMIFSLLKGHEEEVARSLGYSLTTNASLDTQQLVQHQLDLLSTEAFDYANPFRRIAKIINTEYGISKSPSQFYSHRSPYSPFITAKPSIKKTATEIFNSPLKKIPFFTTSPKKEANKKPTENMDNKLLISRANSSPTILARQYIKKADEESKSAFNSLVNSSFH